MVRVYGDQCIWSPTTAVADSKGLVQHMGKEVEEKGVEVRRGVRYVHSTKVRSG